MLLIVAGCVLGALGVILIVAALARRGPRGSRDGGFIDPATGVVLGDQGSEHHHHHHGDSHHHGAAAGHHAGFDGGGHHGGGFDGGGFHGGGHH